MLCVRVALHSLPLSVWGLNETLGKWDHNPSTPSEREWEKEGKHRIIYGSTAKGKEMPSLIRSFTTNKFEAGEVALLFQIKKIVIET